MKCTWVCFGAYALLTVSSPAAAATCDSLRSLSLPNVAVTQAVVVAAGQMRHVIVRHPLR